jgi:hypothetical protein
MYAVFFRDTWEKHIRRAGERETKPESRKVRSGAGEQESEKRSRRPGEERGGEGREGRAASDGEREGGGPNVKRVKGV